MKKKHILFRLVPLVVALTLLVAVIGMMNARASVDAAPATIHATPRYTSIPLHQIGSKTANNALRGHAAGTLPTWSSSFSYQGQNYPYTIVGTNPKSGSATSTTAVDIIPLNFKFANGTTVKGTSITSSLAGSALFHNASFVSGNTQYLDAIQRAEFWSTVSSKSPNYHVLLATPTIKSAVTLTVPSANGSTQGSLGYVDINWFSPKADALAVKNAAPGHLIILAAGNVYQYQGDPTNGCCIGGYHTAVQSGSSTYTYAYAGWDQTNSVFHNIEAMSHEIAEWGDDPYTNNATPNWYAPNYGCSSGLEVGDPAVGSNFTVGKLTYQNEVFFSWFAHESPSQAYQGRYDYLGTLFNSPTTGC
jgi:hypothetical protein